MKTMEKRTLNRRDFIKGAGLAGAVLLLSGCGAPAAGTSAAAASPAAGSAAVTGKVTTGGSTSMEKVMSALQEGFAEQYPDVDITYDPTGSSAGITGAQDGSLDIGLSSRKLKDTETGVTATVIALDGIAIVVHPSNTVSDLTVEQIASVFRGDIKNWKDLGGADAEIAVIGREAGSGTRDGFESICGVKDACVYVQELTATGAVISAVASNAGAIGYASLSALGDTVKALTVGSVACSEDTVLDGSYEIQRPFNFVMKDGTAPSAAVSAFVAFAAGKDAADLIRTAGAVPVA